MVYSVQGLSKNIDISFKYVREDINKLKLNFSKLNDKINELNSQNLELINTLEEIKKSVNLKTKTTTSSMKPKSIPAPTKTHSKKLAFYDVKARKRFETSEYKEVVKNKTLFAVAKSPFGSYDSYRIIKKIK